ncbi:MAG: hybrid sensor histidine kinase/response regulator [Pyrinomonadaceae bacterium]|nr:hybrid sensor histidine kinase/response regulator [Pyrinomonadaceae bacterium]
MRVRMVPLATMVTRLHRTVRVVADQERKLVDLIVEGENIELDTTVIDQMADPLLHALRNAVSHGIEVTERRRLLGKNERGSIRLRAYYEGSEVVIQISDDGSGIDPSALRAKAIAGGFFSSAEAAAMTDKDALSLIFLPGLSTAKEISEVSGRGIGMDIVRDYVNKLQGTLTVDSTPGHGATFTIRLPMTLAVTRALLVKANQETFAVPLSSVKQLLRVEREEVERLSAEPVIRAGGKVYPMIRLGEALNLKQPLDAPLSSRLPVLILGAGENQVALVVDQLIEGREIVIKSLGNHLRRVQGIMGATLLGDGRVIPILNPVDLVGRKVASASAQAPTPRRTAEVRRVINVMIVDDSPSVRRVTSNLIKSAGWQFSTAKDGLDALEVLQNSTELPGVILLDVEMPRMDGYELLAALKRQDAYRLIPVVMVTSRTGEKHRRKGFDLGASEYLSKPYQDDMLLGIIRKLAK